ncbi:unnamed protein product [Parascedosporium putredinis]|uniref:Altered inheritance of mitochondria protein 21 n=1 Tax=Parascedosporium putredinis TaxID=1442378 RepID=A0A9P1HDZ9_9PEZI|nr:unnamed protein product [Parascedosporium putredinis]CAI8004556.1 unnamed protein product [Parascedosporium putredinis]
MSSVDDLKMSSAELNRIVQNTANHHALDTPEYAGTPSEEPPKKPSPAEERESGILDDADVIHVDEPRRSASPEDVRGSARHHYTAPILAEDEVAKASPRPDLQAAVEPSVDAAAEDEEPLTEPIRRPSINFEVLPSDFPRPEARKVPPPPSNYEALFKDGEEEAVEDDDEKTNTRDSAIHKFPSKDIWEDAPSSAYYTTEVSTPDIPSEDPRLKAIDTPERNNPTPVQAFAQYQEELAEKEAQRTKNFVPRGDKPSQSWLPVQEVPQVPKRPNQQKRFPSRDVWEDAPDSALYETTVSADQQPDAKPDIPSRPAKAAEKPSIPDRPARGNEPPAIPDRPGRKSVDKPAVPERRPSIPDRPAVPDRPRVKKELSNEGKAPVVDKPKPFLPPRPARPSSTSPVEASEPPALPKARPSIPSRPAKAAAATAGTAAAPATETREPPAVPKAVAARAAGAQKEEPEPEAAAEEEKPAEKKPLADARKGRARGPQRRAPAKSPAPPAATAPTDAEKPSAPSLALSTAQTVWSIDPESSDLEVKPVEAAAPEPVAESPKDEPLTRESSAVSAASVEKAAPSIVSDTGSAEGAPSESNGPSALDAEEATTAAPSEPRKSIDEEPKLDAAPGPDLGVEADDASKVSDLNAVSADRAGSEKPGAAVAATDAEEAGEGEENNFLPLNDTKA